MMTPVTVELVMCMVPCVGFDWCVQFAAALREGFGT